MGVYIFVIAAALAVFGILMMYKKNVERLKEDPSQIGEAHRSFFIGTAVIEALPIVLLILGLVNLEPVPMEDIYLPAIIIVLLAAFSVFFIFLQRAVGTDEESKQAVNNFSMIAIMMSNAIPIIALVFLFLSVQS